jgi:hypothetical protein
MEEETTRNMVYNFPLTIGLDSILLAPDGSKTNLLESFAVDLRCEGEMTLAQHGAIILAERSRLFSCKFAEIEQFLLHFLLNFPIASFDF